MNGKIILYHGSPNEKVVPTYGLGENRHDYGKGFYLTEQLELAKEWAVCKPGDISGWVHKYEIDMSGLSIIDFAYESTLSWLAELMKHRAAGDSKRYRILAGKFINKYGIDTSEYDVIKGWRENASYFYITKAFVRDEVDIEILDELLFLGGLGVQYCIRTERAYSRLKEIENGLIPVSYCEYNHKYNERDVVARQKMKDLINSDRNKIENVFSTLI